MNLQAFFTIFVTVFLAEIGDKTQLATMLFASDAKVNNWIVFFGSSAALVLAAGLGVLIGGQLENYISAKTIKISAGIGFIVIGIWTIIQK